MSADHKANSKLILELGGITPCTNQPTTRLRITSTIHGRKNAMSVDDEKSLALVNFLFVPLAPFKKEQQCK